MAGTQVFFQFPAHHNAVHHRHHDITDYNIRNAAQCLFQTCSPLAQSSLQNRPRKILQYNHRCPYYLPLSAEYAYHYDRFYIFFFFVLFIGSFLRRVSMQHMGIRVIRQQTDIKSTSHIQRTFNPDLPHAKLPGSLPEPDQYLFLKPDVRFPLLIITVKNMRQCDIGSNTETGVTHTDFRMVYIIPDHLM